MLICNASLHLACCRHHPRCWSCESNTGRRYIHTHSDVFLLADGGIACQDRLQRDRVDTVRYHEASIIGAIPGEQDRAPAGGSVRGQSAVYRAVRSTGDVNK